MHGEAACNDPFPDPPRHWYPAHLLVTSRTPLHPKHREPTLLAAVHIYTALLVAMLLVWWQHYGCEGCHHSSGRKAAATPNMQSVSVVLVNAPLTPAGIEPSFKHH